jgi:hypothetical protein
MKINARSRDRRGAWRRPHRVAQLTWIEVQPR